MRWVICIALGACLCCLPALVAEEGPPHEPMFTVELRLGGWAPTSGRASSKRVAEQLAAQAMLDILK